jgi:hypothetical protein
VNEYSKIYDTGVRKSSQQTSSERDSQNKYDAFSDRNFKVKKSRIDKANYVRKQH